MLRDERMEMDRPYSASDKPGRIDINGIEWWACDPYPHWYRWDDDDLVTSYEHDTNPEMWA